MEAVEVGSVVKPHGYKGSFIANSFSGRDSALGYAPVLLLGEAPDTARPHKVIEADWMPKGWKLTLEGIQSDNEVKALKGQKLFVRRDDLQKPSENQYYILDLIGATVINAEDGSELGEFISAESGQGTHDRWWVETADEPIAIPAIKHFIEAVDVTNRIIRVRNIAELL